MKAGDKLECDEAGIASAVLILSASKTSARLASQITLCVILEFKTEVLDRRR
jgi:hypothetical protein